MHESSHRSLSLPKDNKLPAISSLATKPRTPTADVSLTGL